MCKARYIQDFGCGYYTEGREFESSLLEAIEVRARGGREGPNIESWWLGSETVFN